MKKKKCFVIMGFGVKICPYTKQKIDLDKTFDNIIKPVFEELDIECFRAKDIRHSGIIDVPMYEWLLNADIVVADISTLNANALYELGIRHALKPYTTIVISEKKIKYPFDVNHILIDRYEHLGKDIGFSEVNRFRIELKTKVEDILKNQKNDSPIYTYIKNLIPPHIDKIVDIVKDSKKKTNNMPSLSTLISDAEKAKNNNEFKLAKLLFEEANKIVKNNDFILQRLALVTYKLKKPNEKRALIDAQKIISILNPEISSDPETLGLSGAINKRLFMLTNHQKYLDKSIWFYERGFYIQQDYYNGINLAFLYNLRAVKSKNNEDGITDFIIAKRIRTKVIEICTKLMKENFKERGDKNWIVLTLAEAYYGNGEKLKLKDVQELFKKNNLSVYEIQSYKEQKSKLEYLINEFKKKHKNRLKI